MGEVFAGSTDNKENVQNPIKGKKTFIIVEEKVSILSLPLRAHK